MIIDNKGKWIGKKSKNHLAVFVEVAFGFWKEKTDYDSQKEVRLKYFCFKCFIVQHGDIVT